MKVKLTNPALDKEDSNWAMQIRGGGVDRKVWVAEAARRGKYGFGRSSRDHTLGFRLVRNK
jgi:hypothetical protein